MSELEHFHNWRGQVCEEGPGFLHGQNIYSGAGRPNCANVRGALCELAQYSTFASPANRTTTLLHVLVTHVPSAAKLLGHPQLVQTPHRIAAQHAMVDACARYRI